jgi:hypothetical protein
MNKKKDTKPKKPGILPLLGRGKVASELPGAVKNPNFLGALKAAIYARNLKTFRKIEDLIALESVEQVVDPDPFFEATKSNQRQHAGEQAQPEIFQADSPGFGPEPEIQGIFIGNIIQKDRYGGKLLVPIKSFGEHSAVFGQSGSGKSFLIKHIVPQLRDKGITVIIFDSEGEYGSFLKSCPAEVVWVLDPKSDRDNFLEPPPGVSAKEWLSKLKNIFREVFYLRDGAINLLADLLTKLYRERGVFDGSGDYPTIIDLIKLLDSLSFRPGSRFSGYHESLVNRFKGLLESLEETLCCKKGFDLTKNQKGKIIIYRIGSLSDDVKNFYVNLKILRESSHREKLPPQGLKVAFVIEEAHTLYNQSIAQRYDLGEPMVYRNARKLRKRGICNIYSDQVPSELPAPLSANVNNHFVLKIVNGKCIRRVAQSINLLREQAEYLPIMEKRQCIVQSGDFPEPLLVEIPELSFEYVSPEEIEEHMKPILENLDYTPLNENEMTAFDQSMDMTRTVGKKTEENPGQLWKKILEQVAESGAIPPAEILKEQGISSIWTGRKIVAEMEKQEMIASCRVSSGYRGNRKNYIAITPKGAAFIGADYDTVKLAGKGSLEHRVLQYLISESLKESGQNAAIEYHFNGKSVDIAEIREDHIAVAYEIELQPSHPHVSDNINRDLAAGFSKVVVIVQNKTAKDQAQKQVIENVELKNLSKVEFRLVKEFFTKKKGGK